ncbi:cytochrome P450 6d3 [Ceratitis capitata]|nr:cytochrome P450 6d3 [Ceratitis capitata]
MWFILITLAIVAVTYLIRRQYTYWERHGVVCDKAEIPFGSLKDTALGKKDTGFVFHDIYNRFKSRYVGVYLLFKPALLIRDVELARSIEVKDFSSFHDRGTDTLISKNLFSLRGAAWKSLRTKLTPLFSTGKLKAMLPTVNDIGDKLLGHLNSQLEGKSSVSVDMKAMLTTYAVDIIGSVFFGLDINSYENPNNEFRLLNQEFIKPTRWLDTVYVMASFVCTPIAKFMELFGFIPLSTKQTRDIITHTVNNREKNNIVRKDLLQLLLQLRNTGKISEEDNWTLGATTDGTKSMTIEMIADQSALFYIAGSETTSINSSFTLYELSLHPKYLKTAVEEVDSVLAKHGLKPSDPLTYEAIQDMKFIDLCMNETLRKYPGLPFLNRECTKDFKIPNSEHTIKKGTAIIISILGLHYDPDYFPDPQTFDPYRFTEEKHSYNPDAYMPFGEGPHHCIAKRMGVINSKVVVIKMLANFNIEPKEKKEIEFQYNSGVAYVPKGGLQMKLSRRV